MAHRVAPRAAADLDEIWYYIAMESGSVDVANRLIDSITGRFVLLSGHPYLGRARATILAPAREAFQLANTSSCIAWRTRMC